MTVELTIRPVATDADLDACLDVWNAITPTDPASPELVRTRLAREPRRLYLLAELDGAVAACGFAGPSQTEGRGFVSPRVLPGARRRGIGSALLRDLCAHLEQVDLLSASSHVDGHDPGAIAFAQRFGFVEVDRQVEQVRTIGVEPAVEPPAGVVFTTVAERPELLSETYPLAVQGYADLATPDEVTVTLEEWLEEEAEIPECSFVAFAGGEIVGYTGLTGDPDGIVSDGLTVVRRDWRRRGLATRLKRAKLSAVAERGIREVVTWTQTGNGAMRAVNERLGYRYRDVVLDVRRPLPLDDS